MRKAMRSSELGGGICFTPELCAAENADRNTPWNQPTCVNSVSAH